MTKTTVSLPIPMTAAERLKISQSLMIKVKRMHSEAKLPQRMTAGAIGLDLYAFLLTETGRNNTCLVPPNTTRNVSTGLLVQPPHGYFLAVCSRSGLALQHSVVVANSPGIIDPDYRGELNVLLYNGGQQSYYVRHEDRIAQLIALPAIPALCLAVDALDPTDRVERVLGSTGR